MSFVGLKKFFFDPPAYLLPWAFIGVKSLKKACYKHWEAVGRFNGSNNIIWVIKSIASSEAFGIIVFSEVGTNLGKVNPIWEASL